MNQANPAFNDSYIIARRTARLDELGENLSRTNRLRRLFPKELNRKNAQTLTKKAEKLRKQFENLSGSTATFIIIVQVALEFSLLQITKLVRNYEDRYDDQGWRVLRSLFEFFLTKTIFIYHAKRDVDQGRGLKNIDQATLDRYWHVIEDFHRWRNSTRGVATRIKHDYFQDTYDKSFADYEYQVHLIVHDNFQPADKWLRYDMKYWAIYHLCKHNVIDCYVDEIKLDRKFVSAFQHVEQANHTNEHGGDELTKSNKPFRALHKRKNEDQYYQEHHRCCFVETQRIGRSRSVTYLASHYLCLPANYPPN